jgi:hypothetical protein
VKLWRKSAECGALHAPVIFEKNLYHKHIK